ncbi:MAG TPA: hypothetical protein PKN75_01270 [Bacteroidia bacterium]|nr:hypothetical protein [Bacteroidia bacterium]HNU32203.1 hypothetical protein [Bacteroidia bacterium]
MELKTILYILLGIAWLVYNNYKKIVAENKKRNLNSPPPDLNQPAKPFQNTEFPPSHAPIPPTPRKPAPVFKSKKIIPQAKSFENKKVFKKPEIKKLEETPLPIMLEQIKDFESITNFTPLVTDSHSLVDLPQAINIETKSVKERTFTATKKELQKAFILGEVLHKPRYENAW